MIHFIKKARIPLLRPVLVLVVLIAGVAGEAAATTPAPESAPTTLAVALGAASGKTIAFRPQNGIPPEQGLLLEWDLPHLVLYRNGSLTDPRERTLAIEVTGIQVPPGGVTVTLIVETQHTILGPDGDDERAIVVWRTSQAVDNPTRATMTGVAARFEREFAAETVANGERATTPTDYFRYQVIVNHRHDPGSKPLQTLAKDHAFLMENQWIVSLPDVREESPGAAPGELIVHYCDMFPFRRDTRDPSTWLAREEISYYVESELIPSMVEVFRIQSEEWDLPWHQAWTSYRPEDGRRLSVALSEGETWFHGPAPLRGHAGISINLNGGYAEYESLTDGVMSNFHHELFHNHQRSLNLHRGGNGDVGGKANAWQFFSEGTAVLASSVGQPDVEFARTWGVRTYLSNARNFVGQEGFVGGDLNKSYADLAGYHAAAYWRFLYEQCGGMSGEREDPAAGMAVIWQSLEALYRSDIVDVSGSTELVENLPAIMDRAMEGAQCPFETYEQSLLAFSRAIYALRLEGGRCAMPGTPDRCGFYDPEGLYHDPPASIITYSGEPITYTASNQTYPAGIPSSYGIDLVEVALDPRADGQSLVVEFYPGPGAKARFAVQVWRIGAPGERTSIEPAAQVLSRGPDRRVTYRVAEVNSVQHGGLGLAITRVDAREKMDREGSYTIRLGPADRAGSLANDLPQ